MTRPERTPLGLQLVGVVGGDVPITGAVAQGDFLFVTSAQRLSIFDISAPLTPTLVGSAVSPNPIHGELLPTNGETLLLNDGLGGRTLDVWNVEDRSNPVLITTITDVPDEHWACINSCTWAYGSEGSVVDLRDSSAPKKVDVDWKQRAGISDDADTHRVDEYRPGYLATASGTQPPVVMDVRDALRPKVLARATLPEYRRAGIIYSAWPLGGRARYLLSSVEFQESDECSYKTAGTLLSFDAGRYPQRSRLPFAGRLRTPSKQCQGAGVYFDPSPNYATDGLVAQAYFEGLRVVRVDGAGQMKEMASFEPPLPLVWHAFWVGDDLIYALNQAGEIYILKYS